MQVKANNDVDVPEVRAGELIVSSIKIDSYKVSPPDMTRSRIGTRFRLTRGHGFWENLVSFCKRP